MLQYSVQPLRLAPVDMPCKEPKPRGPAAATSKPKATAIAAKARSKPQSGKRKAEDACPKEGNGHGKATGERSDRGADAVLHAEAGQDNVKARGERSDRGVDAVQQDGRDDSLQACMRQFLELLTEAESAHLKPLLHQCLSAP